MYLLRRAIFVFILVYFESYNGFQLILHMQLSVFYFIYIMHYRPFEDKFMSSWEVFNEACVMMVSYCLMFLQSPYLTPADRYTVGYLQILVYCINLFCNISNILSKLVNVSIPEAYRQRTRAKEAEVYEKKLNEWIQKKIKFCEDNPNVPMTKEVGEVAEIMHMLLSQKKQVIIQRAKIDDQKKWLEAHNLDTKVL